MTSKFNEGSGLGGRGALAGGRETRRERSRAGKRGDRRREGAIVARIMYVQLILVYYKAYHVGLNSRVLSIAPSPYTHTQKYAHS